jgi:cellulose synthase/poly-beta-1,6-N-acetylglucosamine synthase-like glycosyltransferase
LSSVVIVCLIVLSAQIFCLIALLGAFLPVARVRSGGANSVSVVICARNEAPNLRLLVPLLLKQSHEPFEVIVVNDRSVDDSAAFLQRACEKDARLKVIHIDRVPEGLNGKKYGLSRAIREAVHEIVLLTDADCRPATRRWISEMASTFVPECQIVLGYSAYLKTSGLLNTFIRFETLLTGIQYIGMARIGLPYMGVGRNLAYRRSYFLESGGFADFMDVTGGDDDLWVNRNAGKTNTRICTRPASLVWSIPKTTWRSFLNQKLRHLSVGIRYRFMHQALLGLFNALYVFSWILSLICLFLLPAPYAVLFVFALRCALFVALVSVASVRLGDKFSLWPVIILDFLYVIYYISTALRALFIRKIQWTN